MDLIKKKKKKKKKNNNNKLLDRISRAHVYFIEVDNFYIDSKNYYNSDTRYPPSIDMDETARFLIYARFEMENHAWIGFARELK